jgi:hypothetical protein
MIRRSPNRPSVRCLQTANGSPVQADPRDQRHALVSPSDPREQSHALASPSDPRVQRHALVSPSGPREQSHALASPSDPREQRHALVSPSDPRDQRHALVSPSDPREQSHTLVSPADPRKQSHALASPSAAAALRTPALENVSVSTCNCIHFCVFYASACIFVRIACMHMHYSGHSGLKPRGPRRRRFRTKFELPGLRRACHRWRTVAYCSSHSSPACEPSRVVQVTPVPLANRRVLFESLSSRVVPVTRVPLANRRVLLSPSSRKSFKSRWRTVANFPDEGPAGSSRRGGRA